MNRYCLHTEYFPLEADIQADFRALGTRVYNYYNVGQPPIGAHDSPTHGYLAIEMATALGEMDALEEAARYTRPRLLALLSILTYLSDYALRILESPINRTEKKPSDGALISTRTLGDNNDEANHSPITYVYRFVCWAGLFDRR
ncbi:MAG: hypothetical protein ACPGWR_17290 [Ardenticatenaceae bacterium]